MCSRTVNKVNAEETPNDPEKCTLRNVVHDACEVFGISERLQRKVQLGLGPLFVDVPHHRFFSSTFLCVETSGHAVLLTLPPDEFFVGYMVGPCESLSGLRRSPRPSASAQQHESIIPVIRASFTYLLRRASARVAENVLTLFERITPYILEYLVNSGDNVP